MTDRPSVPRVADNGVIRHPLSGEVEFASTDQTLAVQVAEELDRRDPVTAAYLYHLLFALPWAERQTVEWVMPARVRIAILELDRPAGWWVSYRNAEQAGAAATVLLGRPVVIDESSAGVWLRAACHA